jgi:hypothetical protein
MIDPYKQLVIETAANRLVLRALLASLFVSGGDQGQRLAKAVLAAAEAMAPQALRLEGFDIETRTCCGNGRWPCWPNSQIQAIIQTAIENAWDNLKHSLQRGPEHLDSAHLWQARSAVRVYTRCRPSCPRAEGIARAIAVVPPHEPRYVTTACRLEPRNPTRRRTS